ncbi:MAG: WecB/TagA/CpsF family glycosyltransferase [Cytophagales bacterium]
MASEFKLNNDTKKVIDLKVSTLSYSVVLDTIFDLALSKSTSYICFANAHMAVEAHLSPKIANSVNNATIVTSDGMSVVMALKFLHKVKQDRTAGMDMIFDLIKGASDKNLSVFLLGTEQSTIDSFVENAKFQHKNLKIVGSIAPPFTEFTESQNDNYVSQIKDSGAHMVFVSLGCPKQEKWMAENSHRINAVLLGVGGAFPLYAHKTRRAPVFMQKSGFEWLFRLYQEPKRLWRRYLVTNTLFVFYFFRQLLSKSK